MRKVPLALAVLLALSAPVVHGQLFSPVERELAEGSAKVRFSGAITKSLEVAVNASVLSTERFEVELDGIRFTAKGHLESKALGHQVWSGTLEDDGAGDGSIILTRTSHGLWGQIDTPTGVWVVETDSGRGETFLRKFDPSRLKNGGCGVGDSTEVDFDATALRVASAKAAAAGEPYINLRVFYTPERLAAVGGIANLTGITLAQIDITNQALATTGSGLVPFRLADMQPTQRIESGDVLQEMQWFFNDATVNRWRDYPTFPATGRADILVLLVHNNGPSAAGTAVGNGGTNSQYAHAVVGNWEFADGGMAVLAHELGHILGLYHDPQTTPGNGTTAHGWFYQIPAGEWRSDVMTYSRVCPGGCRTQIHYSNPDRLDMGVPTGEVNIANAYAKLTDSTPLASLYRITDVFGTSWARYRARAKQLNVRIEIPARTSTSAKLYKGPSKDGRCQGASFGTVTFQGAVAAGSFPMSTRPARVCIETVQGGKSGTVRFFPVAALP